MSLSERRGLKPARQILQLDSIDDALKNRLWNVLRDSLPTFEPGYDFTYSKNVFIKDFCKTLWHDYLKLPVDSMPGSPIKAIAQIRGHYFACSWNEVYDFIEFVLPRTSSSYSDWNTRQLNEVLESELSAYRLVAGRVVA